jgi:hypothetical protein
MRRAALSDCFSDEPGADVAEFFFASVSSFASNFDGTSAAVTDWNFSLNGWTNARRKQHNHSMRENLCFEPSAANRNDIAGHLKHKIKKTVHIGHHDYYNHIEQKRVEKDQLTGLSRRL